MSRQGAARFRPLLIGLLTLGFVPGVVTQGQGRVLIGERLPRVVYRGGPFVREPRVITVTFLGDDLTVVTRLEKFGEEVAATDWWRAVTDGYCQPAGECIRAGQNGRATRLRRELPKTIRDVDVEALLEAEAVNGALHDLDRDAVIVSYLPAGVTLSDAFNPRYCGDGPRAFHRMLRVANLTVPFAVVPRCGDEAATTMTASHEILEMATNPDPNLPGFRLPPGSPAIAFAASGAEPADVCNLLNPERPRIDERGFAMQRAWSNKAAAAGIDPCAPPAADAPYAALIPRAPVVRLVGDAATTSLVLDAAADRPDLSWKVSAIDLTGRRDGVAYLDLQLDRERVANGETAALSITLRRTDRRRELAIVGLVSLVNEREHLWPLAISMR
jgi:hypothetical protein